MTRWMMSGWIVMQLVACGGGEAPPAPADKAAVEAPAEPSKGALAAQIAAEVRAAPGEAEAVLEKHEMTVAEYEALLFEVASDPELSKEYLAALN